MSKVEQGYPEWKKSVPVPVDLDTLRQAEAQISSCEACTPDLAEVPFDYVLDSITGCDPETTDYVLAMPACCPQCGSSVRSGYWRWMISEDGKRKLYVLPGTLVVLK